MADTTSMYNPLFDKKEYTVTGSDKKMTLSTFNMIAEGSSAFNALTDPQQRFIVAFNNYVQEGAVKAGLDWKRGRIPLIKKSALKQITEGIKGNISRSRIQDVVDNSFKENFIFTSDNIQAEPRGVINLFGDQSNNQMSDPIDAKLGLSEDGHVNIAEYEQYETNMEIVLDMFMVNANKVESLQTSGRMFDAAKALLDYQKSNFFNDSLGANIDWIEVWKGAMLNNKDKVDTPAAKKLMSIIKPTNAVASLGIIGWSATTAIPATIGQELTLISKAIGNKYSNENLFTLSDWARATPKINPVNYKKISAIMDSFQLYDLDVNALASSQRRVADKAIYNTKNAYIMLRMGDWAVRAQAIVAQMVHDGVWDSYTMEDGKLTYDETKDKRFNGQGRYSKEEGKALKAAIVTELEKEGHMKDGRMTRAYDEMLAFKHKTVADDTFGGMDKETRGFWNYLWQGKLLGIFKSWLPARIDAMTQKSGTKLFAGDYRMMKNADGELYAKWEGEMVEGYIYTLGQMGFNLMQYMKQSETKPLTAAQKSNVARMSADLSMIALGYLAIQGVKALGDDDDSQFGNEVAKNMAKSMQDVAVTYNLISEAAGLFALPVSLNYTMRLWKNISSVTVGSGELEKLWGITPWNGEYKMISEYMEIN